MRSNEEPNEHNAYRSGLLTKIKFHMAYKSTTKIQELNNTTYVHRRRHLLRNLAAREGLQEDDRRVHEARVRREPRNSVVHCMRERAGQWDAALPYCAVTYARERRST